MSHPSLVALSARLTTTSSLLLERSRVISLKLAPSASSTAQITRNLQSIRADLTKLEAQFDSLKAGKGKGKAGKESELEKGVREAGERYDRLVEMLEEDDSGKERAKALKREKVVPVQVSPEPQPLSVETSAVPTFSLEPPTPALPNDPFTDEHEDEPLQPIKGGRYRDEEEEAGSDQTPHGLLQEQQMLMDDQDERLNVLSTSIGRQNHLSIQIGSELDRHHELLEETDVAMDRTAARLNKAKRRLDKVAGEAKQYGSTITIVALIFVLLILIIVFKT